MKKFVVIILAIFIAMTVKTAKAMVYYHQKEYPFTIERVSDSLVLIVSDKGRTKLNVDTVNGAVVFTKVEDMANRVILDSIKVDPRIGGGTIIEEAIMEPNTVLKIKRMISYNDNFSGFLWLNRTVSETMLHQEYCFDSRKKMVYYNEYTISTKTKTDWTTNFSLFLFFELLFVLMVVLATLGMLFLPGSYGDY